MFNEILEMKFAKSNAFDKFPQSSQSEEFASPILLRKWIYTIEAYCFITSQEKTFSSNLENTAGATKIITLTGAIRCDAVPRQNVSIVDMRDARSRAAKLGYENASVLCIRSRTVGLWPLSFAKKKGGLFAAAHEDILVIIVALGARCSS